MELKENDNIESEYLQQRQISHELNSPAAKLLRKHAAANQTKTAPAGDDGPPPELPLAQSHETTPGGPPLKGEMFKGHPTPVVRSVATSGEMAASEFNPITDFILGGTAAVGSKIIRGGAKLFPTLYRVLAGGGAAATAAYPAQMAIEKVADEDSPWRIPASIAIPILGGVTFEATVIRAVEKQLAKAAGKIAPEKAAAVAAKAAENYKAGNEDEFTEAIMRDVREAYDTQTAKAAVKSRKDPLVSITDEDAARFMAQGDEALETYGGNINFERISSEDDIKQIINKTQRVFAANMDEARRGKIDNETTQRLADDMGMTVEQLLARRKGAAFNAEEAVASRQLLVSSAERLSQLAAKVANGQANDIDKFNFQKQLTLHEAIQEQVSGMTAEAGRALQSFNIFADAKPAIVSQLDELADATVVLSKKAEQAGIDDLMARVAAIKKEVC